MSIHCSNLIITFLSPLIAQGRLGSDPIFTSDNLVIFLAVTLFFSGMVTFLIGVSILAFRASSNDIKTLAAQTAKLAQKGIAEDISGLVGNAANLIEAMNQLVRTTRGIGIFLIVAGLVMMGGACWIALVIFRI